MSAVRVDRDGAVAVVTLTNPPANAMDAAGLNELADEFDRLGGDADVRAVVLTGEGRAFSAGLDLKAIGSLDDAGQEALVEALNRCFLTVYASPKLVVGAVNGHAIAGGLILALCCDVRLVTDAPLRGALAEVTVGVVYPVAAIEVVRHELAGAARRRMVLKGEVVDGAGGVELGVFDRVVPHEQLRAAALTEAADTRPPLGFVRIKAQLRAPAIAAARAALGGRDPLPRPWLGEETFAAAEAALRR